MENMDNFELKDKEGSEEFHDTDDSAGALLVGVVAVPLAIGFLIFSGLDSKNELSATDNNPNNSRGYYVFRQEEKTTIYDTFGYKGHRVDYTKDPHNIGITNGNTKVSEIYYPSDINKQDLLIQEQTVNKDGIVVFVDNYGVASFYENYQLTEKIDLVAKKALDITGESETLVANPENLNGYSKQKKLIK